VIRIEAPPQDSGRREPRRARRPRPRHVGRPLGWGAVAD
jgi:hypothetical protein